MSKNRTRFSSLTLQTLSLSLLCFTALTSSLSADELSLPSIPPNIENEAYEAYENLPVASIEISAENLPPTVTFDSRTIVNRLKTRVGDPFSQLTFDSDLKTLSDEYDQIAPSISVRQGEIYIAIKVWPKPMIRTIKWEGNNHFKAKTLQKELGIKPHTLFTRATFNQALNKIKELYIKKGYFELQIDYKLSVDPKTNEIDIDIALNEGRSGFIDGITFEGFSKKEQSDLLELMQTKEYHFLISWVLGTGTYNEEALEQDRMTIINYLQNKGYADSTVDIQILDAPSSGKIILKITAVKGPIYHFGEVTFSGNTLFSDKEIENCFSVHPEGIYSPEKLRETAEAIKFLYGRKGYIEAAAHYETKLAEHEPIYNVHFQIEEGAEYKVGLVHILGNVQTQNRVILHESHLIPGETFDTAKLEATQQRLENIGYFKTVNVYAVKTKDSDALGENYRDVYIEVAEKSTGNIAFFLGASSADNVFGGIDLGESNFNISGFSTLFTEGPSSLRGGGEYAHAKLTLGKKQSNYSLSWMNPYFRDTLWRVGFDVYKSTSSLLSNDYEISTLGLALYTSYPITQYLSFGLKYNLRNAEIHIDHHAPWDARQERKNSGVLSGPGTSLTYDSTDAPVKPHQGLRASLEGTYYGLGGNFTFLNLSNAYTLYTPLWKGGIMKYYADVRFIYPFGRTNRATQVPISERFFLGGDTSVRGYQPYDIGPRFSNSDPKGGISSSLLSIEYLQEVVSFLDLFLFADAGSVSLKKFSIPKYNASYGFGARVLVMNQLPFMIGMGFPVNPSSRSQVKKFFFSGGAQF